LGQVPVPARCSGGLKVGGIEGWCCKAMRDTAYLDTVFDLVVQWDVCAV